MKVAHDIYAETNPAFCAAVLYSFIKAYVVDHVEGPEMPTIYLALPIALSGELVSTFDGTNRKTGLLEWLDRSPSVQIGLADRVNASLDIVTDALRLGCFTKIVKVNSGSRLALGNNKIRASAIRSLSEDAAHTIKHAERLGYWFAGAGSTRSIFQIMGMTV